MAYTTHNLHHLNTHTHIDPPLPWRPHLSLQSLTIIVEKDEEKEFVEFKEIGREREEGEGEHGPWVDVEEGLYVHSVNALPGSVVVPSPLFEAGTATPSLAASNLVGLPRSQVRSTFQPSDDGDVPSRSGFVHISDTPFVPFAARVGADTASDPSALSTAAIVGVTSAGIFLCCLLALACIVALVLAQRKRSRHVRPLASHIEGHQGTAAPRSGGTRKFSSSRSTSSRGVRAVAVPVLLSACAVAVFAGARYPIVVHVSAAVKKRCVQVGVDGTPDCSPSACLGCGIIGLDGPTQLDLVNISARHALTAYAYPRQSMERNCVLVWACDKFPSWKTPYSREAVEYLGGEPTEAFSSSRAFEILRDEVVGSFVPLNGYCKTGTESGPIVQSLSEDRMAYVGFDARHKLVVTAVRGSIGSAFSLVTPWSTDPNWSDNLNDELVTEPDGSDAVIPKDLLDLSKPEDQVDLGEAQLIPGGLDKHTMGNGRVHAGFLGVARALAAGNYDGTLRHVLGNISRCDETGKSLMYCGECRGSCGGCSDADCDPEQYRCNSPYFPREGGVVAEPWSVPLVANQDENPSRYGHLVTGHSLGGATAELLGLHLAMSWPYPEVTVVSFGAPRSGNGVWAELVRTELSPMSVRITNTRDPVPHLSPLGETKWLFGDSTTIPRLGFQHALPEWWWNEESVEVAQVKDKQRPAPEGFVRCDGGVPRPLWEGEDELVFNPDDPDRTALPLGAQEDLKCSNSVYLSNNNVAVSQVVGAALNQGDHAMVRYLLREMHL